MARPKTPLIERGAAIEAALALIDADGLDAFSIRRLGAALGVNGASLYHHFADKEEILTEVVRLVLSDLRIPRGRTETWQTWFVTAATAYRSAVLAHPNVAPLLVSRRPRMYGQEVFDYTARLLTEGGVPPAYQLAVMDASEMLAFASAMFAIATPEGGGFGPLGDDVPALTRAVHDNVLDHDAAFRAIATALLSGIEARIDDGTFGSSRAAPRADEASRRNGRGVRRRS